jgi:CRP-like cAMP-binding protein
MASSENNQLLAMLPVDDLVALERHLFIVDLRPGQTLARPGDDIRRVYFPHSGIVSFMVDTPDGQLLQTGMVGQDGVIGAAQASDDKISINRIIVQIPGTASMIDRDPLRKAMQEGSAVQRILAAHEQFFVADIQQTAACNALHSLEARMCRWMLRMMDLVGPDLRVTHDYLAAMIGVRRSGVSQVAARLQDEGIISYGRGHISIENVAGLRQSSCKCYEAVRKNYSMLLGSAPTSQN